MTFRIKVVARLIPGNASAAAFLALLITANVTLPIPGYAQQGSFAAGPQVESASVDSSAWLTSSFRPPVESPSSNLKFDFGALAIHGNPAGTSAGPGEGGFLAGNPSFATFNLPMLTSDPGGTDPASGAANEKRHIRKGWLVLGIIGVGVAAVGVFAVAKNTHSSCQNQILSNVCNDVHTAGEIMVPAGAAVAVTGFYLAFRHK